MESKKLKVRGEPRVIIERKFTGTKSLKEVFDLINLKVTEENIKKRLKEHKAGFPLMIREMVSP